MIINNRSRLLLALVFNKLADLLISAKTTLPALLMATGAPGWMVGWLVPIRESGALLPQAGIGLVLRRYQGRHWIWRLGMSTQALAVTLMLTAGVMLQGWSAGAVILASLAGLALGRACCSLTMKDIQADVVDKGERGRLIGLASTASGIITLMVAVPLVIWQGALDLSLSLALVAGAALAFAIALILLWPVKTYVDTEPQSTGPSHKTRFWQFDSVVYRFILVRGLYVHSALVAPYFMLEVDQPAQQLLPVYLAAQALASLLSAFFWGRVSDYSARLTLQLAGALAVLACAGLLWLQEPEIWQAAVAFLLLSIAHAGVRTGRKTYSLDVKEGQQRTELVAFSNTAIGVILLAFGVLYSALSSWLDFSVISVMAAMLCVGIALSWCLPAEK